MPLSHPLRLRNGHASAAIAVAVAVADCLERDRMPDRRTAGRGCGSRQALQIDDGDARGMRRWSIGPTA